MYIYKMLGEEIRKKDSDSKLISRYRSSLEAYCELDTLGMVQIVKKLRELIQQGKNNCIFSKLKVYKEFRQEMS